MKKTKQIHKKFDKLSAEQVVRFLNDFGQTVAGKDKKTKAISLRVPENILHVFKLTADQKQQKYQSVIVQLMREWIANESGKN